MANQLAAVEVARPGELPGEKVPVASTVTAGKTPPPEARPLLKTRTEPPVIVPLLTSFPAMRVSPPVG